MVLSNSIFSQNVSELGMTPKWSDGKITLKNKSTYEGPIYYNTHFGTIQYKSDDEIISLQENKVLSMTFFDKDLKDPRSYYTFTYRDTLTDKDHELLFEILKDFKTFGVLSRLTKASIFLPSNNSPNRNILHDFGVPPDKMFIQVEGIFFVNERNKLELFSLIKDMDYDGVLYNYSKSKSKIIKEKLLREYTGKYWEEIKIYIKQNKLKLKMKPDLLRILDHYEQLTKA